MTGHQRRASVGLIAVLAALTVGCLDLNPSGKTFACPNCPPVGGGTGTLGATGGGAGGGSGGGGAACTCQLPAARCDGSSRVAAALASCHSDGGCEFQWVETPCPSGCANGLCIGQPCHGVVCNQAPPPRCLNPTTLSVYANPGSCQGGGCVYATAEVSCACENDRCRQNPCVGTVCNQPPAAACEGASLRTWQAPGACDANTGQCVYSSTLTSCGVPGCHDGRCNGDPCAGVSCTSPPAPTCLNASTVQVPVSPGTCNPATGGCAYSTRSEACAANTTCLQGVCTRLDAGCGPVNCALGCCEGTNCVSVAAQSNARCGIQGAMCGGCGSSAPVCENGLCVNRCAGVSCNHPPASTCFDATTVTVWSGGTCSPLTGACSYTSTNITCGPGNTCTNGACSCVSEPDSAFCDRLRRRCGPAFGTDNCGVPRMVVSCGTCRLPETCQPAGTCACVPEPDTTFCGRLEKNCGTVRGQDNCGSTRTANCGVCASPETCGPDNICTCTPETNSAFCERYQKNCGSFTANDNCGVSRTAVCGGCRAPETCSASNVCTCSPESNEEFCDRHRKDCGSFTASDNCGSTRTANCGTCQPPETCSASNVCACVPELDAAFCGRFSKNCGSFTETDNCGETRTANCGVCAPPTTCSAHNVCVAPARLSFSTNWQTIPGTTPRVEFRCLGAVSTTPDGGTRCSRTPQDPVQFRISGATYAFYPGCDGDRPTMCMTQRTPNGATYKEWGLFSAARLLCEAMGWPRTRGNADHSAGTIDRSVAVIQVEPSLVGTEGPPGLRNYSTFVSCDP